jgi:16S rRNA processing protein RimM
LPTGKVDAYVIATPEGKEILVAAIADNIKEINVAEKKIVVHLPEWEEVK